jgi:hypothetical protein
LGSWVLGFLGSWVLGLSERRSVMRFDILYILRFVFYVLLGVFCVAFMFFLLYLLFTHIGGAGGM